MRQARRGCETALAGVAEPLRAVRARRCSFRTATTSRSSRWPSRSTTSPSSSASTACRQALMHPCAQRVPEDLCLPTSTLFGAPCMLFFGLQVVPASVCQVGESPAELQDLQICYVYIMLAVRLRSSGLGCCSTDHRHSTHVVSLHKGKGAEMRAPRCRWRPCTSCRRAARRRGSA
jgi:hypothetical protein